jgi:7-cyano-7-deazaguanine synthase
VSPSERAVVLLSGGLGAAVTLAMALRERTRVFALTLDYGQTNVEETIFAAQQADAAGIVDRTLNLERSIFEDHRGEVPRSVARNMLFLSFAVSMAQTYSAGRIYIGSTLESRSLAMDERDEFLAAFGQAARLATKGDPFLHSDDLTIIAPLVNLRLSQVIRLGQEYGVDFARTQSCLHPIDLHHPCGRCGGCTRRQAAFQAAGLLDPLPYPEPAPEKS